MLAKDVAVEAIRGSNMFRNKLFHFSKLSTMQ